MKKNICSILALLMIFSFLVSCDTKVEEPTDTGAPTVSQTEENTELKSETEQSIEEDNKKDTEDYTEEETEKDADRVTEKDTEKATEKGNEKATEKVTERATKAPTKETETEKTYRYTDFKETEKSLMREHIGFVLPFMPNNSYTLDVALSADDGTEGIMFSCYAKTRAEIQQYLENFPSQNLVYKSDDGLFYMYRRGQYLIDIYISRENGKYCIDVYAYPNVESTPEKEYLYTDFTSSEKQIFNRYIGEVVPLIPNDEYYLNGWYGDEEYKYGINFYSVDNTEEEFLSYLNSLTDYELYATEIDENGDKWYYYVNDASVIMSISYYYYEEHWIVDVYVVSPLSEDRDEESTQHTYLDFTPAEKTLINSKLGFMIPFMCNDAYYVKDILEFNYDLTGVWFATLGNTQEEFDAYLELYADYVSEGTDEDDDGFTWYMFHKDGVRVEIVYYSHNDTYYTEVFAYLHSDNSEDETSTPTEDEIDPPSNHNYNDFKPEEKALFEQYIGELIPFIPNDEYYVEGYYDETGYEYGMCFYTFGNTAAEFEAYLEKFSSYELYETYKDDDGDTWYCYIKNDDVVVDVSYYYYEGEWVVDLYVYSSLSKDPDDDSGSTGGGSTGGGTTTPSDVDLITNDGAGLPNDDGDGVYDVDFTRGNYVQNVTDQGYYIDGCPTTGSPAVLVIPVEFSDVTARSKGYTTDDLEKIFNGAENDTVYYSVHDYFFMSSYGQLDLEITVLDEWFRPAKTSSYYKNETYDYYGDEMAIGDQLILDEALAYLATVMDLSVFDSDGNDIIDAVIMVNTLDVDMDSDFHWAYRYWNVYTDDEGYYYEYDGVSANDYIWMSCGFMFEAYDEETGEVNYDSTNPLNPYTFIHEFGHVLGADDYYDTSYEGAEPLGGCDVMDSMAGDHNPFTKFNYGWLTESRLVVTDSTVTLTLDAFASDGDTIILANNWDDKLGAYQEYYIIMYYTGTGLNSGEGGYFLRDGIVVYHVNSSLYAEEYEGETYYDVYNNNTSASDEYGTEDNLIEYVKSAEDNFTYVAGDTLPEVTDDLGNTLGYTFTVDSLTDTTATITFSKVN